MFRVVCVCFVIGTRIVHFRPDKMTSPYFDYDYRAFSFLLAGLCYRWHCRFCLLLLFEIVCRLPRQTAIDFSPKFVQLAICCQKKKKNRFHYSTATAVDAADVCKIRLVFFVVSTLRGFFCSRRFIFLVRLSTICNFHAKKKKSECVIYYYVRQALIWCLAPDVWTLFVCAVTCPCVSFVLDLSRCLRSLQFVFSSFYYIYSVAFSECVVPCCVLKRKINGRRRQCF